MKFRNELMEMLKFFKKEPKEILDCLGVYDIKPYHYFESNMVYAKDILILNTKEVKVYSRLYKSTLFIFVFVDDEVGFDKQKYTYESLKEQIDSVITEPHKNLVQLTIFKNQNEETIRIAKEPVVNTKQAFYQTFVYDAQKVRLKYYRPVPEFYSLYNYYAEAIYFDLGAIDLSKR